jgi:hypothetical protein
MSDSTGEEAAGLSRTARWLLEEYGAVLSAPLTAKLMAYKSIDALRQARCRNMLPVAMFPIEGRRGWFANTIDVARWIDETLEQAAQREHD